MAVSTPRPDGATSTERSGPGGLTRSLSVWQAVGLSVALMAPSMAANINPQGTAGTVGRAVPLAFLLAAVGVLLVAYGFVRLCQYFHHAGSVYAFVGATLGPRAGLVSGFGLLGTYCFYGVVTSSATGIFGTAFLEAVGIWPDPPSWAPFLLVAVALLGALVLTIVPARRGTSVLLTVEGVTVALILVISAIVLVRLLSGNVPADAPSPDAGFTLDVFTVAPGTDLSAVFLGVVFGFLSFAGFEAAATLGEEARNPRKDIPRAILGTAVFGGIYFVVVTAIEMMGFGTDEAGVAAFASSPSLLGDLGSSYIAGWVGDLITLGAAISAFGCCLACVVGASRLTYAFARDTRRDTTRAGGLASTTAAGTPALAAIVVTVVMALVQLVCAVAFDAEAFDTFLWSGTIGTLILLVAYLLTTVGAIRLVFVQRRMPAVPMWQVVVPLLALVVLGYTVYRNVAPYPAYDDGAPFWFPIVAGVWLLVGLVAVVVAPAMAQRAGAALTAAELGARREEQVAEGR
ncbi:APC family permease [Modestobacter altitudinis]|uniref:APC family permease n=1 Tax=Modestobacter altitudinis TaxID=2213158 RepID=UPI00110CD66D|nr:APC family permease [Modestobacter altitudinis]